MDISVDRMNILNRLLAACRLLVNPPTVDELWRRVEEARSLIAQFDGSKKPRRIQKAKNPRCATCKWWDHTMGNQGRCRRAIPTILSRRALAQYYVIWQFTMAHEWCAGHEPAEIAEIDEESTEKGE